MQFLKSLLLLLGLQSLTVHAIREFNIKISRYEGNSCRETGKRHHLSRKLKGDGHCFKLHGDEEFGSFRYVWASRMSHFDVKPESYGNCTLTAYEDEYCHGRVVGERAHANHNFTCVSLDDVARSLTLKCKK